MDNYGEESEDRPHKRPKGENRPSQTESSQPLSRQVPALVEYTCGHINAKPLTHTVDILVKSVKFVPDQRNTEEGFIKGLIKGRIDFEYVPYVDGSITLEFSEMVLERPGSSPTKKVLESIPLDVKKGSGKQLMSALITSPLRMRGLKEKYKVEIKTKAEKVASEFNVCQLTLAVIEMVKGDIQIRVTDQIVWVDEHVFWCLDSTGIFKAMNIVKKTSDLQCGRCLVIKNPGVLHPIGDIRVFHEVGRGSQATVLKGTFQNRHCAVKKHPVKNKDAAYNDIKMMTDIIGSHSNIVSYYGMAEDVNFVLVAVEMCNSSLDKLIASRVFENDKYKLTLEGFKDLVLWKRKKDPRSKEPPPKDICIVYPSEHLLKILRGIVTGLSWLHSRNISHNNLKIQNVLINRDTTVVDTDVVDITAKLSNFSRSTIGSGSSGGQERTFDRDLYDLGNLILDCITIPRAGHTTKPNTNKVNWVKHLPEAHDLIPKLLNLNPKLRPTAAQVKMHPFFWGPKERLSFLYYASECIKKNDQESKIQEVYENMYYESLDTKVDKELTKEIENVQANLNEKNRTTATASDCENRRSKIYTALLDNKDYNGWDNNVGEELVKQIKARQVFLNEKNCTTFTPSYHGVSLLQAIRNHYIHLPSLPKKLRIELGENFTQLDDYFSSPFPKLLMQVYDLFKGNPVNGKTLIDEYFELWEIKVINA